MFYFLVKNVKKVYNNDLDCHIVLVSFKHLFGINYTCKKGKNNCIDSSDSHDFLWIDTLYSIK